MSKSVSYSVAPEEWHHTVAISRHAHARASSPPGASSAAGISLGSEAAAGSKENSASVTAVDSAKADSGGTSVSRRLTTCGRRRPTFLTRTWPTVDVAPSTHASSIGVARTNGIVRAARIVTAPRAGGFNSTSQRSAPVVPPVALRRSEESSRRADTVPIAGGKSDHSRRSSTGSENCTTMESRSEAAGRHSNVTASVRRSSRTVSRTSVRASSGGRRRTSRAVRDAARKPAQTRVRAAPSSISVVRRLSGPIT